MLKAIHAQESKKAAREKAKAVVEELRAMKLKEAAKKVEDSIEETLTYCDFPSEHWTRIRTNNVIERLNREIRRRTRVVGSFPDGNSALMLVCARLRHVAGTQWGNKKYMNMKHLEAAVEKESEHSYYRCARILFQTWKIKPRCQSEEIFFHNIYFLLFFSCSLNAFFSISRPSFLVKAS